MSLDCSISYRRLRQLFYLLPFSYLASSFLGNELITQTYYSAQILKSQARVPVRSRLSTVDYSELSPALRRGRGRYWRLLRRSAASSKIAYCPNPIRDAERHCRRAPQGLMHAAEIVEGDVQRHGRQMAFQPLAKAIGRAAQTASMPCAASGFAAQRSWSRFAPVRRFLPCCSTATTAARRIAPGRFGYIQVGYAVGLIDDAVSGALAESIADRVLIGMSSVRCDFGDADDALAQVLNELVGHFRVALASAVSDDRAA